MQFYITLTRILCSAKQQCLVGLYENGSVLLWDDVGSTIPILVFIQKKKKYGGIITFRIKAYMVDPKFDYGKHYSWRNYGYSTKFN